MWVFSRGGFCSVKFAGDGTVMVRCRTKKHAEHFANLCGAWQIETTPDADYRYRFAAKSAEFAAAMATEAMRIDYPNFKASISHDDDEYAAALGRIWCVHAGLQKGGDDDEE